MKNTENTEKNYPTKFEQYFINKPTKMSLYEYFFSIINPGRFPYWVIGFIYLVINLSKLDGWTIAFIGTLAGMMGKSGRTIQRTIRALVEIELLEERIDGNHRRYRVNQINFDKLRGKYKGTNIIEDFNNERITQDYYTENERVTPDVTPEFPTSHFELIDYEAKKASTVRDCNINNMVVNHQEDDLNLSDSIFNESDKENDQLPQNLIKLDAVEVEIKQKFETITGKPLDLKKNRKPLKELAKMAKEAKDIVLLAFSNVANYISETGNKVYNLAYVLTTAKNLIKQKISPNTTAKDYAHACVGGDVAKYREEAVVETPEQKAQRLERESKLIEQELKHDQLRKELFDALSQQDKNELIEMEVDYLKSQPVWEKLKPSWPWFDSRGAINHAIDRIKQYLLQEYLDHQAFLTAQPSG